MNERFKKLLWFSAGQIYQTGKFSLWILDSLFNCFSKQKTSRCHSESIPVNLRCIDRKKVRAATVKIKKIKKLRQLQKKNQYYVLLAISLLRWWITRTRRLQKTSNQFSKKESCRGLGQKVL